MLSCNRNMIISCLKIRKYIYTFQTSDIKSITALDKRGISDMGLKLTMGKLLCFLLCCCYCYCCCFCCNISESIVALVPVVAVATVAAFLFVCCCSC